jgi:RimJ/RimL family protein N-acetyltransferase
VWRIRADVPDEVARRLIRLATDEPPLRDAADRPLHEADYVDVLWGDSRAAKTDSGPVYWFGAEVLPPAQPVTIDETNADLLRGGLDDWLPDVPHRQPMVAAIEDGRAVSVCASVRITARSHEAGVETLPAYRRRGHAASTVAGWAHQVSRRGIDKIFYSTSWTNLASQGVADRLGLSLLGVDFSVT